MTAPKHPIRHLGAHAIEGTPKFFVQITELGGDGELDREIRVVYNRFELIHPVFVMNNERRRWKQKDNVMLDKLLNFLNESHDGNL